MRKAFSMVELLVVIAIIAILASLIFSVFGKSKDRAAVAVSTSNLRQIHHALMLYEADNGEFPIPNPYLPSFTAYFGGKMIEPPLAEPVTSRVKPVQGGYRIHANRNFIGYDAPTRECFDRRGESMPFAHDPYFSTAYYARTRRGSFYLFVRKDGSVDRQDGSFVNDLMLHPDRYPCPGVWTWANMD